MKVRMISYVIAFSLMTAFVPAYACDKANSLLEVVHAGNGCLGPHWVVCNPEEMEKLKGFLVNLTPVKEQANPETANLASRTAMLMNWPERFTLYKSKQADKDFPVEIHVDRDVAGMVTLYISPPEGYKGGKVFHDSRGLMKYLLEESKQKETEDEECNG